MGIGVTGAGSGTAPETGPAGGNLMGARETPFVGAIAVPVLAGGIALGTADCVPVIVDGRAAVGNAELVEGGRPKEPGGG
jgi:hypothetical protein